MQPSHKITFSKFDVMRKESREIAHQELPAYLRRATRLEGIDNAALMASKLWDQEPSRMVKRF